LDVILTNDPILISSVGVEAPFSSSDHNSIVFNVYSGDCKDPCNDSTDVIKRYLWLQGDYESMSSYLQNVNWNELLTTNFSADSLWAAFCEELNTAIDLFVPSVFTPVERKFKLRKYPKYIRRLMQRKRAVWRHMKLKPDDTNLAARFNKLTADCRLATRQYELKLESKVIDNNNLGAFYRFVNAKSSCRSGVGSLVGPDGEVAVTDKDKAELLNSFFSSVCTVDNGSTPPATSAITQGNHVSSVLFDDFKVLKAARRIKTKSKFSAGPDGYPVLLIHKLIPALAGPLSLFYNSFMSIGKIPAEWKSATVIPVYKRKGQSSDPASYRPISQTSVFCKLMERVIAAELNDFLLANGLISRHQHGFIAKRSTTTNLMDSLNDWTLAIDNKQSNTIVYVDFARAFDTVTSEKLKIKLEACGINGQLLTLILDFLRNRNQVTKVGNSLSKPTALTSGVVQGSCLGPLLFLIFINDLASIFGPSITPKLYADDLKLYSTLTCSSAHDIFQQNLDRLSDWASLWQLSISIKKCHLAQVGGRRGHTDIANTFTLCGSVLSYTDNVSDLGVCIDRHLTFAVHIDNITRKASQRCYLIYKSFQSRDRNMLVRAFKTYVRPLLETNSQIWSPHLVTHIRKIEAIQRRFTKRLRGLYYCPYSDRLAILGLERLDVRRLRADLVFAYKLIFGLTSLDPNDYFKLVKSGNTRNRHAYKLYFPVCKTDVRKYFFSVRVVRVWNDLPSTTDFSCLSAFKRTINTFNLTKYCINL